LEVQNYDNGFNPFFNGIDYTIFPALWASEVMEFGSDETSLWFYFNY
jgi:hypothetical protein